MAGPRLKLDRHLPKISVYFVFLILSISTILSQVSSETSKMGRCPKFPQNSAVNCSSVPDECNVSEDCEGVQHCCSDGCHRACIQPVYSACEHQRMSSEKRSRDLVLDSNSNATVHIPSCRPDGHFESVQCDGESSLCWCVDQAGFELSGTRAPSKDSVNCTTPRPCAGHLCRMLCPFEFELDEEGCPLCQCHDPCAGIQCHGGTQCQLEVVQCDEEPCPPVPTCKQPRSLDNICQFGEALAISERNRLFLCGLEPGKPQCPSFFDCIIQPGMEYGVCCPSPDKLTKPGTCPNQTKNYERCGSQCQHDMECEGLEKCCLSEHCGMTCTPMIENTPCLQQRILAELLSVNEKSGQGYIPQCTTQGLFKAKQCSRNGLICWCVDQNGFKVARSMGPAASVHCQTDSNNSAFANPHSCDNVLCAQVCPYGFKVDANGCQTCDCANLCESIKCPASTECILVVNEFCDEEPCESYPICKPPPILYSKPGECPTGDPKKCVNASCVHDYDCEGSQKCCFTPHCGNICLEHPQPLLRLPTMCEYLRDFGTNAIDRTRARSLAFPDVACQSDGRYEPVQCHDAHCWCVDEFGTEVTGSRLKDSMKDKLDCSTALRNKGCDGLLCRLGCDYGFDFGDDGCPICSCRNPCSSISCPEDHKCEVVEVDCYGGFCPAVPQCIPAKGAAVHCPVGQAFRDPTTNITIACGPSSLCPKGYFCQSEEGRDFNEGICCKKSVKPGQCPYLFMPKFGHCEGAAECDSDHHCPGIQKCCSDGCKSTCVEPDRKTACEHHAAAAHFMTQQQSVLLGDIHQPKCDETDGNFVPVQCHSLGHSCWCVDDAGRELPSTRTKHGQKPNCSAPPKPCSTISECNLTCPYGYKLDDKNCGQCACHNPCEDILCSRKNEECRIVKVHCIAEPCPPVPMCVPRMDNPCPYGNPIPEMRCSSYPNEPVCPSTHVCLQSPLDEFLPLCCPKPREVCFQGPASLECPAVNHTLWSFNWSKNACEIAPTGMCPSTPNRFSSRSDCEATCPALSECERSREKALHITKKTSGFGFIPKCKRDGSWETMQCLPEVGLCWCVDTSGSYIKGSAVRGIPRCARSRMGRKLDMIGRDAETATLHLALKDNGLVCPVGQNVHLCNASLCEGKVCLNQPSAVCLVDPCGGCQYRFFLNDYPVDCNNGLSACQLDVQNILNSDSWSLQTIDFLGVLLGPKIGLIGETMFESLGNSASEQGNPLNITKRQTNADFILDHREENIKPLYVNNTPATSWTAISMVVMPPRCAVTGEYTNVQKQGELSWCVDQKGEPIDSSFTRGFVHCGPNGEILDRKATGPVCANLAETPKVCRKECLISDCPSHPDAICLADPCDDCRVTFVSRSGEQVQCEEKCRQPLEVGMCRAAFPRWHFNETSGQCESFIFGGCLGNDNNFETEDQCINECLTPVDICALPKRVGMCRASMKRWWFNKKMHRCERFIFGGCNGNANNFETKEHCEATCPDVVLCPRLELADSSQPCQRSVLCANQTCPADPEALCSVNPCDCSIHFINYDGEKVEQCDVTTSSNTWRNDDGNTEKPVSSSDTLIISSTLGQVNRTVFDETTASSESTSASSIMTNATTRSLTKCQKKREWALQKNFTQVPQCDDLGHFLPLQCVNEAYQQLQSGSSEKQPKCWCVDEAGHRLPDAPKFLKGTHECYVTLIDSISMNLVFLHNNPKEVDHHQVQIKRKIFTILRELQPLFIEDDIKLHISPQTLEINFNLTDNNKIDAADLILEKMDGEKVLLPLTGLKLKLDKQLSLVKHHTSTIDPDENVVQRTTYIIVGLFGAGVVLFAFGLLTFILIRRHRSQRYYPRNSLESLSPINNSVILGREKDASKPCHTLPWSPDLMNSYSFHIQKQTSLSSVTSVEHEYETLRHGRHEKKMLESPLDSFF